MKWFNHQNVLSDILISDLDPAAHEGRRIRVELPSSYGLQAQFEATRAVVLKAEPYNAAA
jgi:hypothetical protein